MKIINKLLLVAFSIALYSCDDIIEKDITDDLITINYPQNNQQIESNVVNFQWNEVDGANDYRVQIYASGQNMVLDSLVSGNHFVHSLNPGSYQWRVRGENFAYQTAYTFPASFTLIETSDLGNQQVILVSPANNIYTKNTGQTFSWTGINAAESYTFELVNVTSGNNIIHQQTDITGTSYTLASSVITDDAHYSWKVKAVNEASETPFASRTLYIDRTPPNQPQNSLPANDINVNDGSLINFSWAAPNDTGVITSSIQYTIQIASDQNFSTVIQTESMSTTTYQYTFTATGNYYWRVKAFDAAGNQGSYSNYSRIVVQ